MKVRQQVMSVSVKWMKMRQESEKQGRYHDVSEGKVIMCVKEGKLEQVRTGDECSR